MFTLCWSAKGGSGTTVVAAALAVAAPTPTLLVDLAGDLPLVLGIPVPTGPGVGDWSVSSAGTDRLDALRTSVTPGVDLVHRGRIAPVGRWAELGRHLAGLDASVVVDAGTGAPPAELCEYADRTLLVTRPCYLALHRAVALRESVDGIVLIDEPGRALTTADVSAALGAPVVAQLDFDPSVARAVDAGLLLSRLPAALRRELGAAA
jgi:MinD superfamily P-loop ATPase